MDLTQDPGLIFDEARAANAEAHSVSYKDSGHSSECEDLKRHSLAQFFDLHTEKACNEGQRDEDEC